MPRRNSRTASSISLQDRDHLRLVGPRRICDVDRHHLPTGCIGDRCAERPENQDVVRGRHHGRRHPLGKVSERDTDLEKLVHHDLVDAAGGHNPGGVHRESPGRVEPGQGGRGLAAAGVVLVDHQDLGQVLGDVAAGLLQRPDLLQRVAAGQHRQERRDLGVGCQFGVALVHDLAQFMSPDGSVGAVHQAVHHMFEVGVHRRIDLRHEPSLGHTGRRFPLIGAVRGRCRGFARQ